MSDERAVAELLADRPDLEDAVAAALDTDEAAAGPWTFDDVPVDSGAFGELVAAGVVVEAGDGYRLADPEAARTALAGEATDPGDAADDAGDAPVGGVPSVARPSVDARAAGALAAVVAFVVALRLTNWPAVFRDGAVVLTGNDPYHYRVIVEDAVAGGLGAALGPAMGEPLYVATMWLAATALGGVASVGHLLALYPVVSAAVTAVLTYGLGAVLTGDRRVAVAGAAMLAAMPAHAFRTSVGFADHHAFDYPWLVLTALALAALWTDRWRRPAAAALAVGVAGQVLAWSAGPLLVLPVAGVVLVAVAQDVAADRSPVAENGPLLAGLAGAAVLAAGVHLALGWHGTVVGFAPAGLAGGAVGAVGLGELWRRRGYPARSLAGVFAGGSVAVALVVRLVPPVWERAGAGFGALTTERRIAEAVGLFTAESFGFLFLFGLALFVALGVLPLAVMRTAEGDRPWAVVTVYTGWFLALSLLQVRFAAELSPFVAVLTGYAFVYLAARIEVARPPTAGVGRLRWPGTRAVGALVVLFVLVAGFGLVQVPIKSAQVTITGEEYRTAAFVDEHADEHDLAYPEDYVLSRWPNNRMYNYFVNGHARSYGYAVEHTDPFLQADDPGPWYERFRDRVGYVVIERSGFVESDGNYALLADRFGSRGDEGAPGSGHFRAIRAAADGFPKAYAVVPGATVAGSAGANETVTLRTDVAVPGAAFTYERQVVAGPDGAWNATVAYPGSYDLTVGGEAAGSVRVADGAVRTGGDVAA